MLNLFFQGAGESLRLQPRKGGAVLSSLGISNRTRIKSGWVVSVDREDAEKLPLSAEHYGRNKTTAHAPVGRHDFLIPMAGNQLLHSRVGEVLMRGATRKSPFV